MGMNESSLVSNDSLLTLAHFALPLFVEAEEKEEGEEGQVIERVELEEMHFKRNTLRRSIRVAERVEVDEVLVFIGFQATLSCNEESVFLFFSAPNDRLVLKVDEAHLSTHPTFMVVMYALGGSEEVGEFGKGLYEPKQRLLLHSFSSLHLFHLSPRQPPHIWTHTDHLLSFFFFLSSFPLSFTQRE